MYKIEFSPKALRLLKKLPENITNRVREALKKVAITPRAGEKLIGVDAYRVRIGDYRIIYEIKDNPLLIIVINVGHRRDIYKSK